MVIVADPEAPEPVPLPLSWSREPLRCRMTDVVVCLFVYPTKKFLFFARTSPFLFGFRFLFPRHQRLPFLSWLASLTWKYGSSTLAARDNVNTLPVFLRTGDGPPELVHDDLCSQACKKKTQALRFSISPNFLRFLQTKQKGTERKYLDAVGAVRWLCLGSHDGQSVWPPPS